MISVTIFINGSPVYTRSAHKIEGETGVCKYRVDDGRTVTHDYEEGAVPLAIKLLEGVRE
jgi:hypothetical protein